MSKTYEKGKIDVVSLMMAMIRGSVVCIGSRFSRDSRLERRFSCSTWQNDVIGIGVEIRLIRSSRKLVLDNIILTR